MEPVSISDIIANDTPSPQVSYSLTPPAETTRWFPSITWSVIIRYSLIILILAFLGFNLFTYLGKITDNIANFLKPMLRVLGYGVTETVNVSADGAKGLIDIAAGTVTGGINVLEDGIDVKGQVRNKIDNTNSNVNNDTSIDSILSKAATKKSQNNNSDEPTPDDAGSRTQTNRSLSKSGFCYIGEDRGFRSCIKVGEADMCMSGDIFPTQAICINPNLRE